MKKALIISFCIIVTLALARQDPAQTTAFTYQGNLVVSGVPGNGNHDFEFALFDNVSGGTQVGSTLTRSAVAVANGIFSVSLDFGSQFPGSNRFLEIRVRQTGGGAFTPLTPRQEVNSSPHSVTSLNANQLGGFAASQYVRSGASSINAGAQFNIGGNRVLGVSGTANVFAGVNAGTANTGTENSFFGFRAGEVNSTGSRNSFFGTTAGSLNTTGTANSFFGFASGRFNTTGSSNAFFGDQTGANNTSGNNNSFYGATAGSANTTGNGNSFFGNFTGAANTTANLNSFFGQQAGADNETGSQNTFVGNNAGRRNTTASRNAFFGSFAGENNTVGADNSFFGGSVGSFTTTGSGNAFFGSDAGESNITGGQNTMIGTNANVLSGGLINATAIGNRAAVGQNNSLVLGSINAVNGATADTNVGIGTTAPTNLLTIGPPEATVVNGRVGIFSPSGTNLILRETTNDIEGIMGVNTSNGVIYGSMTSHNVNLRTGNTNRLTINPIGDVGIGTSSPTARFHVAGASSNGNAPIAIVESSGTQIPLFFRSGTGEVARIRANDTGNLFFATTGGTEKNMFFRAGDDAGTDMYIEAATGNVGIGTTAPNHLLTVGAPDTPVLSSTLFGVYGAGFANTIVRDTTNNVEGQFSATSTGVVYGSTTDHDVRIRRNGLTLLTLVSSGSVLTGFNLGVGGAMSVGTLSTGGSGAVCRNANNFLADCSSSRRYKTNINDFSAGLELIKRLRPVSFNWKAGGKPDLGLVAEEVADVEPLLTTTNSNGEVEGVKYDRVGVVLVNVVKEQQAQIESLQEQIKTQRAEIDAFRELLCSQNRTAEVCQPKK